ncbi:hypothetical protein ABPG74_005802 [Tetrahymena malaccensis]
MSLNNQNKISHCLLIQILCFVTQFLLLVLIYPEERYIYLLCFSIPTLFIFMLLYYFIFWRPLSNRVIAYNTVNLSLFIASLWIYFDTFFGIYNKTLNIQLQEVSQCEVIGKETINLGGAELYSILYIDFVYNNQQLLGYSCQSSISKSNINYKISPNQFYFKRDKIACDYYNQDSNDTFYPQEQAKNIQQYQSTNDINHYNAQKIPRCYNYYTFSDVKLPSWLCIPSDFPYQTMIDSENCYLNFYGNKQIAYQNALNRTALKDVQDFALITYNKIPIPIWTYQPLLIIDFNMLIISLNSFYFYIVFYFKHSLFYLLGKKVDFQELKEEDDCLFCQLQKQKEQRILLNQNENQSNNLKELNKTNETIQQPKNQLNFQTKQNFINKNSNIQQQHLEIKITEKSEKLNSNKNNFENQQKNSQLHKDIVIIQKLDENLITDNNMNQYLATEVDYVQEDTSLNSQKQEGEQDQTLKPQLIEIQSSNISSQGNFELKKVNYFNSPTDTLISFTPRRKKLTAAQSTFN